MPVAIYVFSLCTFAFGLCEFVVAGLVSAIAVDLGASIAAVGTAIAAYALGASIGAPFVTALLAHCKDRSILLLAMGVLALGSILMSLSPNLGVLLAVRFFVGLGHGVFMAVASDAATQLVPPARSGRALSVVWIGLTLALAAGVPLGSLVGNLWSWRAIFLAIAALSLLGILGLMLCMDSHAKPPARGHAWHRIRAIAHPQLLLTAGVAALVSMATFSFFTYVSPYLLRITAVDVAWLSLALLGFGLCSVVGNLLGGWLADRRDAGRSTLLALAGLAVNLAALYALRDSAPAMLVLVASLGIFFFAIVTLLTMRLLLQAQRHAPQATAVAAGLNIASFNAGTAVGGILGSFTIAWTSLAHVPLVGALAALLAAALLCLQARRRCAGPAGA